jgi:uncharacterized protein (DUF2141 family)
MYFNLLSLASFLLVLISGQNANATIKYVKYNAGGTNDGSSWTNAYPDLQTALTTASAGDTVWVAAGTYKPTSGTNQTISFVIPSGVKVFGGLVGTELPNYDLDLRSIELNATILSGNLDNQNDSLDNSYHVVKTNYVSAATIVDGFTIRDGNSNIGFPNDRGAGWYNNSAGSGSSLPTIKNCRFTNNYAVNGGALFNAGENGGNASPSIINCVFYANRAGYGGAIFNYADNGTSSPTMAFCTLASNTATTQGGAVFNLRPGSGTIAFGITNSIFWNNSAVSSGNTFYNNTASVNLSYSIVEEADCTALNAGGATVNCGTGVLFNQNPLFTDLANGNFHLECGSPATGKGIANGTLTDISGAARTGNPDIGAYEAVSESLSRISASQSPLTFSAISTFKTGFGNHQPVTFTDLNGDGLLDFLVGTSFGDLYLYQQASLNSYNFNVVSGVFNSIDAGEYSVPTFTDLDHDGLLDLVVGSYGGPGDLSYHYEQTALGGSVFGFVSNVLSGVFPGNRPRPAFTDLDGDGLLDLLVGNFDGVLKHYEQTTMNGLSFSLVTASFNNIDVGFYSAPVLLDLDGDGLLDLLIGEDEGNIHHYKQNAINSTSFTLVTETFNSIDVGSSAYPTFTDIDNDGLADLIIAGSGGLSKSEQSGVSLTAFTSIVNNPSTEQSFKVWGVSCFIDDITVTAPSGFEVSLSSGSGFSNAVTIPLSAGRVPNTDVYVRYNSTSGGVLNTNLVLSAANASSVLIPISGTAACGSIDMIMNVPANIGQTASLSASCSSGVVKWYDITESSLLYTGSPFVTPALSANTSYKLRCEDTGCSSPFQEVAVRVIKPTIAASTSPLSFSVPVDFNNINVTQASPAFTDLDGDGLLDLLVGSFSSGTLRHYEQVSANDTSYALVSNAFNNIDVGYYSVPIFTDMDKDGLIDLIIGEQDGNLNYYEQAEGNSLVFNLVTENFNGIDVGDDSNPTFTDLDGDGLLDLLISEQTVNINHYEQASAKSLVFNLVTANFNSIANGGYRSTTFADPDHNGRIDLVAGGQGGFTEHYQSTAANALTFDFLVSNFIQNVGIIYSIPRFVDMDNDGLLELVVGNYNNLKYAEQTTDTLAFTAAVGDSSASQSFHLWGGDVLSAGITVTAPTEFEVSVYANSGFSTSLSIAHIGGKVLDTLIYLRYKPTSGTAVTPNVQLTSTNANTFLFPIRGTPICTPPTLTAYAEFCVGEVPSLSASCSFGILKWYDETGSNLLQIGNTFSPAAMTVDSTFKLRCEDATCNSAFQDVFLRIDSPSISASLNASIFSAVNFLDGIDIGDNSAPTFTDLDKDGLLDLIIGESDGTLNHYEQTTLNGTTFGLIGANFNSIDVSSNAAPTFTDLDGDGLLDMVIGDYFGKLHHYEQASALSGAFNLVSNNFNGIDVGFQAKPAFTDIDGDNMLDLIIGESDGNLNHYEQVSFRSLDFNLVTTSFNAIDPNIYSAPSFIDMEGDGRLDLILGQGTNKVEYYRQTAINSNSFVLADNDFVNTNLSGYNTPAFAKFKDDGLLLMALGNSDGGLQSYEQQRGSFTSFAIVQGFPSTSQNINVWGTFVCSAITITAPAGFEVSVDGGTSFAFSKTINASNHKVLNANVHVRLSSLTVGNYAGNLQISSPGITTLTFALSGNTKPSPPVITAGTYCQGSTLQNVPVSGSNNIWYNTYNGTTVLPITTELVHDTYYNATQTINGLESNKAYFLANVVSLPPTPSISVSSNSINSGETVTLTATNCNANIVWSLPDLTGSPVQVSMNNTTGFYATCVGQYCSSPPSNVELVMVNENPCFSQLTLQSAGDDYDTGTHLRNAEINSGNITGSNKITGTARVTYKAKSVVLSPGFQANSGTYFTAETGGCINN